MFPAGLACLPGVGSCATYFIGSCFGACLSQAFTQMAKTSARFAYCFLFLLSMVLAWVMRDFSAPLMKKIPWIAEEAKSHVFFGKEAVYRISLGNFIFFGTLALVLLGVRYRSDRRDKNVQHGSWLFKACLWLVCNILPFFFPNGFVNAYSYVARFGSGIFLVVQMIILLDFTHTWNDSWVAMEDQRYLVGLLAISGGCYLGSTVVIGLLIYWFKPSGAGDCSFNMFIVAATIILCLLFTMASLHPQAKGGSLFPSAIITLYCTYLAYSALSSEPHDYTCNGLGHKLDLSSGSTLALGMVLTICSVVYSALRAGSQSDVFFTTAPAAASSSAPLVTMSDDEGDSDDGEDPHGGEGSDGEEGGGGGERRSRHRRTKAMEEFRPVAYNYSFFHMIFALASMYIAMLMTGWGSVDEAKNLIDVGWTSVWVKVASQWVTALMYGWSLIAPVLLPDRDFGF